MELGLVLLLGLFTYIIVQRRVTGMTRTPVWLLWLVLMTPALIWSTWTAIYGSKQPLPNALVFGPLIICPVLYWLLIYWGRKDPNPSAVQPPTPASELQVAAEAKAESTPVRPIDQAEETKLRSCFPWSTYYIQNVEYRPQAIICRGHLRTKPTNAYQQIRQNVETQFGDRFLVLFQEGLNGKPFFALVPNPLLANGQTKQQLIRPGLALALMVATLFTTTLVGVEMAGGNFKAINSNPTVLLQGLPYGLAIMVIFGIRELVHYLTAGFYQIRSTLPYFIPVPFFVGTFGAYSQMRSPIPNRKALFDVSISGSLAGFLVTLPLLIWGLAHSNVVTPTPQQMETMLSIDALNPQYSVLLALLSKLALGSQLTADRAIDLHPVAVAGLLGLVFTALNLMPVGQLDGGRIVHAMFGQQKAVAIGQIARFLLLGLSLVRPGFLLWAILLFFMPIFDQPALNDVTELDDKRDFWGLLALGILVTIILPVPQVLIDWLQI